MKVSASGTPGMTVVIAPGSCFINAGEGQQGIYFGYNDANLTLTISTASATLPRIDAVICTVRDAESSGASNDVRLLVVAGTPASSPVPPTLSVSYPNTTVLAYVAVAANATSIISANITDKRPKSMIPNAAVASLSAIASPVEGQLAYQLSDHRLYVYDNTSTWQLVWPITAGAITGAMIASNTILPSNMTTTSAYGINISGNAATATSATSATTAAGVPYSGLTGTVPTWNQNTTGTAANADNADALDNLGQSELDQASTIVARDSSSFISAQSYYAYGPAAHFTSTLMGTTGYTNLGGNQSYFGCRIKNYDAGTGANPIVYALVTSGRAVIINSNGTLGTSASTRTVKENIRDYDNAAVLNLQPVLFDYKENVLDGDESRFNHVGLIAEDVDDAGLTHLVYKDPDGTINGVAYERLAVDLLVVVKELNNKINDLETRLATLEANR
jgi:hypothetical protein